MKTFAKNRKQSTPARHKARSYARQPLGSMHRVQRKEIRRILRSTGAQAKLTIGQANDKYEQEADHVADQVMAMPDPRLQRQSVNEEEEETLQTKPLADQITPLLQRNEEPPGEEEETAQARGDGGPSTASSTVESDIDSLRGGGQPLPRQSRRFFESRLGNDFSGVRIHANSKAAGIAQSVQAKAFTLGRDVVFNQGEYAPQSSSGKRLLAHELTHVVQQRHRPVLQREIVTRSGLFIDRYLTKKGIRFVRSMNAYKGLSVDKSALVKEILSSMLLSDRRFYVAGVTQSSVVKSLAEHVAARKRITGYARMANFGFGAGSARRLNPVYWTKSRHIRPGKKPMAAYLDLIRSKSYAYKIACAAAAQVIMWAGTKDQKLREDTNVKGNDWIPGDRGYIRNMTYHPLANNRVQTGQNIIYVGSNKYWGHTIPKPTFKTRSDWMRVVSKWGIPFLKRRRDRPGNGLV